MTRYRVTPDRGAHVGWTFLGAIGNTTLVRLRGVVRPRSAAILAKLEWENPTGSMKDRMAAAVIIGYVPPLWEPTLVDEILAVSTNDAKEMARAPAWSFSCPTRA